MPAYFEENELKSPLILPFSKGEKSNFPLPKERIKVRVWRAEALRYINAVRKPRLS